MQRISSTYLGLASGHVALFDHYESASDMYAGLGPRSVQALVTFETPFLEPPRVILSVSLIDKDTETPYRLGIDPRAITETGFTAEARTWGDTRIARLSLNWTAIGAVADPDEAWDV